MKRIKTHIKVKQDHLQRSANGPYLKDSVHDLGGGGAELGRSERVALTNIHYQM